MTPEIQKLIEDGKWRPIEKAQPCEDYNPHSYLLRDKESFVYIGYSIDGVSWFESGSEVLRIFPTHFRPLPDNRLADVLEVAVKALEFYANIEADGTADFALAEIQKIAERKAR